MACSTDKGVSKVQRQEKAVTGQLRAFNVNGAADLLNIPPASLRAHIRNGTVRAARIGQRYYIPVTELERLLTLVGDASQGGSA